MRVLKRGMLGDDVKLAQVMLVNNKQNPGAIDGVFGLRTLMAVTHFQLQSGLTADGIIGKETYAKLLVSPPPSSEPSNTTDRPEIERTLRYELVGLCQEDVGEREDMGYNRSKMIDEINRELHQAKGSAYCIGGILVRGVKVLCKKHGLKNPVPMTAGTQYFRTHIPDDYWRPPGIAGLKADVGIFRNYSNHDKGHGVLFMEDEVGEDFVTLEYNTDIAGSREGDGVYISKRSQRGSKDKEYMGCADVIKMIMDANPDFKEIKNV